jgi:beta-glucosidase
VADDSYHRYAEDIEIVKNMGMNAYRMSIAWSRIIPDGGSVINQAGIDHYSKVIDTVLAAGITPFVTMFHWDTPSALEHSIGGWLSPTIEDNFVTYANVLFSSYGDRVKHWITLNEPLTVAQVGYNYGVHAPGRCSDRSHCAEVKSFLLFSNIF